MAFVAFDPPNIFSQLCTSMETSSCGSNRSDSALLCFILSAAVPTAWKCCKELKSGAAFFFFELLVFRSIIFEGRFLFSFPGSELNTCVFENHVAVFSLELEFQRNDLKQKFNKSWIYPPPRMPLWQMSPFRNWDSPWPKNVVNLVFVSSIGSKPQI